MGEPKTIEAAAVETKFDVSTQVVIGPSTALPREAVDKAQQDPAKTAEAQAAQLVAGVQPDYNGIPGMREQVEKMQQQLASPTDEKAPPHQEQFDTFMKMMGDQLTDKQKESLTKINELIKDNKINQQQAMELIQKATTNPEGLAEAGVTPQEAEELKKLNQELEDVVAEEEQGNLPPDKAAQLKTDKVSKLKRMMDIMKKIGFIALVLVLGPLMSGMMSMGSQGAQ